jgi:ectoine hydroxylase-related dioxygenase (phytanoyl-CoA dioxygenase family)
MGPSLAKFIADGYLIIPGAVDPEVADRIAATIANAFEQGDERLRYQGLTQEIFKLEGKTDPYQRRIIESHAVLPEVRDAFASPRIVAFLEAIFGEPAVLAQSIIFQVGSEQPLHRDTTFVRFENPLSMVGCWIALEDVRFGSGALSYVVGSHRMPDFPYSNGKKDGMEVHPDELHRSLMWVVEESDSRGLSKQLFHPKKGDALIWHADLAHGGSPITDPQLTRKSLVGHLCPLSVRRSDQPATTPRRQHGPIQYSSMYYDLS